MNTFFDDTAIIVLILGVEMLWSEVSSGLADQQYQHNGGVAFLAKSFNTRYNS